MKSKILGLIALGLVAGPIGVRAAALDTTFAGGNYFAGNMFDVTVGTKDLSVTGVDVHVGLFGAGGGAGAGYNALISVHARVGGYAGFESSAAAWSLLSQTSATSQGLGNRTFVDVTDFLLSANTLYGFYVTLTNYSFGQQGMIYSNGSATYSNADLSISSGNGRGDPDFSGATIASRIWNGAFYYDVSAVPEPGTLALLGLGLAGLGLSRRRRAN